MLLDYGCGKGRVDFSYPTRQDAVASELNMTNAFMRKQWKIRKKPYRKRGYHFH